MPELSTGKHDRGRYPDVSADKMELIDNPRGDYRFLTGIAPYSSGVVANAGCEIVRAVLHRPLPYRAGFDRIARHLEGEGRRPHALCAIELRLPEPVSFAGFGEFNAGYQSLLADWDLLVGGINPVARTNVAPEVVRLAEPALYAFSYTRAAGGSHTGVSEGGRSTFVVAGAGDIVEQSLSTHAIVREGETTADAMREKAAHVMGVMGDRLRGLGAEWNDVTAVDIYTVHALESYLREVVLVAMNESAIHGVHWHRVRPPIHGLEFEMDVRGVAAELNLE